jgi:hypothetical protein
MAVLSEYLLGSVGGSVPVNNAQRRYKRVQSVLLLAHRFVGQGEKVLPVTACPQKRKHIEEDETAAQPIASTWA